MRKKPLGIILLVIFLIIIYLVFHIKFKTDKQCVKVKYMPKQVGKIDINTEEHKSKNLPSQNEEESNKDDWKSIERQESYNNELQYYSKDNVVINGDIIEITSKKENKGSKMYTSGLVESTSAYKYGYFEFTIEVSKGKGIFPAIWLLPDDGNGLPEIDLFEMIGSEPNIFYGVIHFEEDGLQKRDYFAHKVPTKKEYSVSLEWKPQSLTWYIDNQEVYLTAKGVPQEYMYIIINQAIGGDWPGNPDDNTIFPNKFRILSTYIKPIFKKGRD